MITPPEGNVVLLLVETKDDTSADFLRDGRPYQTVTLNCPDLEYTHQTLKEKDVEVTEIVTGGEHAKYFIFADPSGNHIKATCSIWD